MKTKQLIAKSCVLLLSATFVSPIFAQGTAFTYQGRLNSGTNPVNGSYDLTFSLFITASGPGQAGSTLTNSIGISNGLFMTTLDFGANFPGADRWLEIGVRTNGGGAFTTLSPRQKLTPTPYAVTAANLSGILPSNQLPANVALLNANETFVGNINIQGDHSITGNLTVTGPAVRWNGNNGEGSFVVGGIPNAGEIYFGVLNASGTASANNFMIAGFGLNNLPLVSIKANKTDFAGAIAINGTTIINASGQWVGSPTGLVGPQGPQGVQGVQGATGPQGTAGVDGKTVRSGSGVPSSGLGVNGDFYINTAANTIYGPKTSGAWGSATSLIGPQGPPGPAVTQNANCNVVANGYTQCSSVCNGASKVVSQNYPTDGGLCTVTGDNGSCSIGTNVSLNRYGYCCLCIP